MRATLLALSACLAAACVTPAERCVRQHGSWYSSMRDPNARGACVLPSSDGDRPCRDKKDCAILCACPLEVSGRLPPDGTEVTGSCAAFPPRSGGGWTCEVVNGRVMQHGTIVD